MIGGSQFRNNIRGHPLEEPLKIYPVIELVNSPKTDDARCIEPVPTASRSVVNSCKEPPDCAAQQRESDKTQCYFQNDDADFERHIEHQTANDHDGHLNCR
jgi:hypothetical protein